MKNFWYRNKQSICNFLIAGLSTLLFVWLDTSEYFISCLSVITSISGALIGFLITAMSLFYTLPVREEIKKRIIDFQFNIIIPRVMFLGIIALLIEILVYIFYPFYFVLYPLFIFGLLQTACSVWYVIVLAKKGL